MRLHDNVDETDRRQADSRTCDKCRLELGAGGGLVGLAVALGCGEDTRLLVTDQQEMFGLMDTNIRLNKIESRAKALILNWYVPHPLMCLFALTRKFIVIYRGERLPEEVVSQKPNVILAAECVYFEPAFPLLMQTLRGLFAVNEDAIVYFCFKKRRRADMQFVKMAKKAFLVEELFDEDRAIFQRQALFLFSFRSKPNSGRPTNVHNAGLPPAARDV